MDTGNKIKHFRLLKGFSQEKMAELLGIAPKSYGNIERNITDVNLSRLQQIANVLEVSLPKLLDFDEKNIIQGNYNNQNNTHCNFYSEQNSYPYQRKTKYGKPTFERKESIFRRQDWELRGGNCVNEKRKIAWQKIRKMSVVY